MDGIRRPNSVVKYETALAEGLLTTRFKSQFAEDHDLIVMGDFNVPKFGDKHFEALTIGSPLTPFTYR